MTRSGKVVAVVVTWNRKELLARNLRAVMAQTRPVDEILVVDNASTDGTPEMLAAEFPQVRVVRLAGNAGGAGGFHVGVREALSLAPEWLWLMDDDGLPSPGCLAELLRVAERERFSLCGPLVSATEDCNRLAVPQPSGMPTTISAFRTAVATDSYACVKPPLFNGVLLHAEAARRAGLPNAAMFMWGDDNEYCERLNRLGYRAGLAVNADYTHPDLTKRGWWLINIRTPLFSKRSVLMCDITSPRLGIVARNLGYRTRAYYGLLAAVLLLIWGMFRCMQKGNLVCSATYSRYFIDGMLDRFALEPSRTALLKITQSA